MRHRLLLSSVVCVALLAVSAAASFARDRAGHACNASNCAAHAATAYVPLPSQPVPAVRTPLAVLPSLAQQPLVSGLRAFIDPESGLITSPIGLLQAPVDLAASEPDYTNLPQVQLPNGSFMIDTRGIMLEDMVVQVDALGHRAFQCSHSTKNVPAPVLAPTHAPYAER